MKSVPLVLGLALLVSTGCAVDDDLTEGKGFDNDADAVVLEAEPTPADSSVDTTKPDVPVVETSPDTTAPDVADTHVVDTAMPECTIAADCAGADSECAKRACTGGVCSFTYTAAGTASASQIAGDCKQVQCDGMGSLTTVYDPADSANDDNECTTDSCVGPVPTFNPLPRGSGCSKGGTKCDGGGRCVECLDTSSCPGSDTACSVRTCTGVCGRMNLADGTVTSAQTAGDCRQQQCDGAGSIKSVPLNTDAPVDGNACTKDVCTSGTPSNPPEPASTPCPTGYCNGSGTCVTCIVPGHCPTPPVCYAATCKGGTCGTSYLGNGAACPLSGGVTGWCYLPTSGPAQCLAPIG